MSINSIQFNEPDYNIDKSSNKNIKTQQTTELNSFEEDNLQEIQILDESSSNNEMQELERIHKEILNQLKQQLEIIRQEKQMLISQLAVAQDSESRESLISEISELNNKTNSIYIDIVKELQNYNTELNEIIIGTTQQKVEDSSFLQELQNSSNYNANIQSTLEGYNSQAGQKIAQSALTVRGTTGWCLAGVNDSLERVYGTGLYYHSAYQSIPELQSGQGMGAHFKEVSVSRDELPSLPPGSIVVWEPSEGHQHGHISIALGDGRESSDYIGKQMTSRDANYHVFIPIS